MAIKTLNPYLNFNGTANDAIKLYESALGATAESVMRFGDIPDMPSPPELAQQIMHASLRIGESGVIMISDTPPDQRVGPDGGSTWVALHCDDVADMTKQFTALSEGGTVIMPLADTFWGAHFGMLIDRYGIRWMFNCELKK